MLVVAPTHAQTDNFESYSTGSENLVGQAAAIGSGNWVEMDGNTGRLPSGGSESVLASNGFSGQGVKGTATAHRSAAFDLGKTLTTGDSVSIMMQFDNSADGPETHLYVGNASLDDGTVDAEVAFMVRMDSDATNYNITADTFDGDANEIGGSVGAGTRVENVGSFGDWYELRINLGPSGGSGVTDATLDYRNVTVGDPFASMTFATGPGLGSGNTFIGLGTFADGGNFDNLVVIPEPTSISLLALGAVVIPVLLVFRRKS